jgi:hypothetical protein
VFWLPRDDSSVTYTLQRWWNDGVVHTWLLQQIDGELEHVTSCGVLILVNKVDLYGCAPVTCLACLSNEVV